MSNSINSLSLSVNRAILDDLLQRFQGTKDFVMESTEQARTSLEDTMQQTGELGHFITEAIQLSSIQEWSAVHPFGIWILTHPLYTLSLIILCVLLFGGLLRLINRLTEQVWLFVLRFPVNLIRWICRGFFRAFKGGAKLDYDSEETHIKKQIDILKRLDEIKREESELIQQLQTLLTDKHTKSL